MECRMLGLLSAIWFLTAAAWAADPAPRCLCLPSTWTVKMNMNQGMKVGHGGPGDLVQFGEGIQYGDFHRGWIVGVFDLVPGGQVTTYQGLGDPIWYVKTAAGCMTIPAVIQIPSGPTFCYNTTMEFKGTETFGHGEVEVWQLGDKSSGLFMKQYLSMVSPEQCFPAYQTITVTKEEYAYSQGALFTNYQGSVDDTSIFDFPDECKNALPMPNPSSGAQVKTMSVLALVFIFVLNLGF